MLYKSDQFKSTVYVPEWEGCRGGRAGSQGWSLKEWARWGPPQGWWAPGGHVHWPYWRWWGWWGWQHWRCAGMMQGRGRRGRGWNAAGERENGSVSKGRLWNEVKQLLILQCKTRHTDLSLELWLHHGIWLAVEAGLGHRHAVLRVGHAQVRGWGVHVGPTVNTLPLQRLHTDESWRLKQRRCSLAVMNIINNKIKRKNTKSNTN